ncbi:MAG: DUF1549 domain-containing protein, partial [Pirellulaceae bacterium]|nr:DUF1549 domain-containing protein [Pirellulaceae bacterium]
MRLIQRRSIVCILQVLCGFVVTLAVTNRGWTAEKPVSFVNDVVPMLTKAGCNSGLCHAKAGNGQNGFELSLLGFEPQEDYEHMAREGRARRLFPAAPDRSLLLLKASGKVAHGGGIRLPPESDGYQLLRRWIQQGTPFHGESDPDLVSIEVQPPRGTLNKDSQRELKTIARYSDDSTRDITALALYESNDIGMATVTGEGLVTALDVPGKFAVMIRYQAEAAVFTGSIPLGAPVEDMPASNNFIDDLVFSNLKELGIPPSPVADDATFLRRVTLDIAGRLPTSEETSEFLSDEGFDKRNELIDRLLS